MMSKASEVNKMIRLLYMSQAAHGITSEDVREIFQLAQHKNPEFGITGVLLHGGGMFMQVLEGSEQSVIQLYLNILKDSRHSHCHILVVTPMQERMFQDWAMGVIKTERDEFEHILDLQIQIMNEVLPQIFTETISGFLKRLNGLPSAW
jgi:hypothetical protein